MKSNTQILVRSLGLICALALGACAKGANTFDDTANGVGGATGGLATCGNAVIDANEQCDPKLVVTVTCQSLAAAAAGMVFCDPTTCRWNTTMCGASTGVGGTGM